MYYGNVGNKKVQGVTVSHKLLNVYH